jgi:hypothetical protein
MDSIRETLRAVAELAEKGVDGERENAQRMLEKLCRKHGIDPSELLDEAVGPVEFKLKNDLDKRLLIQCVLSITRTRAIRNYVKGKRAVFWVTKADGIDIREAFEHYRKELSRYLDESFSAFVHANRLLAPAEESDDDDKPLTPEEMARLKRIANMMLFAGAPSPKKSLPLHPQSEQS